MKLEYVNINNIDTAKEEAVQFLKFPVLLFENEEYLDMSVYAKVLYGIMLDRAGLSLLNRGRFTDKLGRAFIYFSQEEAQKFLKCCRVKAGKTFKELEEYSLIEREDCGIGRKPKIYVKRFLNLKMPSEEYVAESWDITISESDTTVDFFWQVDSDGVFYMDENPSSSVAPAEEASQPTEVIQPEVQEEMTAVPAQPSMYTKYTRMYTKCTRYIESDLQEPDLLVSPLSSPQNEKETKMDGMTNPWKEKATRKQQSEKRASYAEALEKAKRQVRHMEQVGHKASFSAEAIEELTEVLAWAYSTPRQKLKVGGVPMSTEKVRKTLFALDGTQLVGLLTNIFSEKRNIKNRRSYFLTCLYNAGFKAPKAFTYESSSIYKQFVYNL